MTAPRFLIDENLSPALVGPARARGFEAVHVNHLGLYIETDRDLLKVISEQDWVLVTNNAIEFRGRYREVELHPGVVFLLPAVRRPDQVRLKLAAAKRVNSCAWRTVRCWASKATIIRAARDGAKLLKLWVRGGKIPKHVMAAAHQLQISLSFIAVLLRPPEPFVDQVDFRPRRPDSSWTSFGRRAASTRHPRSAPYRRAERVAADTQGEFEQARPEAFQRLGDIRKSALGTMVKARGISMCAPPEKQYGGSCQLIYSI